MKSVKNKVIIILSFILIILLFFGINKLTKKQHKKITEEEAKNKIMEIFSDNKIEKLENQSLILTKNNDYMIMVVGDQYILTDFSENPPIIHHYKSIKPDIKVKVLKIENDGYLVEHDDHSHFIYGKLDKNVKVGDYVYIKDPHTYLQDNHANEENHQ
ncbi:hypothetical protein [Helcococcus kunzii]|uniref:hypothetical protein n=1 Tax=Helcococcus kunzii TaxID=40091 RepID=UPI0024ADBCE1|nr:hypothetical protein [Helcococcus kunzii]